MDEDEKLKRFLRRKGVPIPPSQPGSIAERAAKSTPSAEASSRGDDDIAELSSLNEPSLLELVKTRYEAKSIYTRAGPVLVAVNPYTDVSQLYAAEVRETYRHAASVSVTEASIVSLARREKKMDGASARPRALLSSLLVAISAPVSCAL